MDADSSYGGSDTAQDSHSGHDNSSSLDTTTPQPEPNNFYHKNEITLPVNYDETDFQETKATKQPHYLSTANLNINETLEHHSNLEEMSKNYKSTSYLNESPRIRKKADEGVDNPAFQEEEYKPEVKSTFGNNKPYNGDLNSSTMLGLTSPNKNEEPLTEAVNLELINLKPAGKDVTGAYENGTNGMTSIPVKKENDAEIGNPYDEYFVPVNEHRKYMRGEKLYVTMDKRNKKKRNKCLCWGLCLCIVAAAVIIGILAAVGVIGNQGPIHEVSARHFGSGATEAPIIKAGGVFGLPKNVINDTTKPPTDLTPKPPIVTVPPALPTTDTSMIQVPRALESQLKIDNLEFTPALADKNSTEYKKLAEQVETALKNSLFSSDVLNYGAADIEVKVMDFSSGSVVVNYRITWVFKDGIHNAKDPITEEMLKRKMRNIVDNNNGFVDTYHVVDNTVTVERIIDSCKIDNNGCEYNCSFDYKLANFMCLCPDGKYLNHDGKTCGDQEDYDVQFQEHHYHEQHEPTSEPKAEPSPEPEPEPTHEEEHHTTVQPQAEPSPSPEPTKEHEIHEPEPEPTAEPEPEPVTEPKLVETYHHQEETVPIIEPESTENPEEHSNQNYVQEVPTTERHNNEHDSIVAVVPEEPSAEPTTQKSSTESSNEHDIETIPEPTSEPAAEHEVVTTTKEPQSSVVGVVEPAAEPTAEPTAEPAAEPTAEPAAEPTAEPAAEPSAEPAAEPTPEPAAEPTPEPAAEPTPEPAAEPTPEPAAEPTPEPAAEPKSEPAAEPTPEPKADSAADVKIEIAAQPTTEPAAEPTAEPAAEPTAEPTAEPIAPQVIRTEQNVEPAAEPTAVEHNTEPVAEPTTEPPAEPSPIITVEHSTEQITSSTEKTEIENKTETNHEVSPSSTESTSEVIVPVVTTTPRTENEPRHNQDSIIFAEPEITTTPKAAETEAPPAVMEIVQSNVTTENPVLTTQTHEENLLIPVQVNEQPRLLQVHETEENQTVPIIINEQPVVLPSDLEIKNSTELGNATVIDSTENTSAMDNMSPFLPEIDNDTFVNKLHLGEHIFPQNETHDDETEATPPRRLDNDQMNVTNPHDTNVTDALKVVPLSGNDNEVLDKIEVTTFVPKMEDSKETGSFVVPVVVQEVTTEATMNVTENQALATSEGSVVITTPVTTTTTEETHPTIAPEILNNVHSNSFFDNAAQENKSSEVSDDISTSTEDLIALETTTNREKVPETKIITTEVPTTKETPSTVHAEILDTVTESVRFDAKNQTEDSTTPAADNTAQAYEVNEAITDFTTTEKLFLAAKSTEIPTIEEDLSVVPLPSDEDNESKVNEKRVAFDAASPLENTENDISIEEQVVMDKFHHTENDINDATTTKTDNGPSESEPSKYDESKGSKKNYYEKEKPKYEKKVKLEKGITTVPEDEILTSAVPSDTQPHPFSDIRPVTEDFAVPDSARCSYGQFQCVNGTSVKDGSYCIPENDRCDSVDDCSDGSDEIDCVKNGCPNNFQCASGQCLKRHLVCDGIQNCNDGSDETSCDHWSCRFDEFSCGQGNRCLPILWKCDGKSQCLDGSDEHNCPTNQCSEDSFHCTEQNTCVPKTWRCDGESDCINAEDESSCECGNDEFKCAIGGGCIKQEQVCDGASQCADQSDEWGCVRLEKKYLEVKSGNNSWYPVCSDKWNQTHSDQICRKLGYGGSSLTESTAPETQEIFLKLKPEQTYGASVLTQLEKTNSCETVVTITCQEFACGSHSTLDVHSARIIGGNRGVETQWPSLTLLYNKRQNLQCTATLVAPTWVMASYSCVYDLARTTPVLPSDWILYAGSTNFFSNLDNSTTQVGQVSRILPHPQAKFSHFEYANDAVLVELVKPLTMTRNVSAMCLPENDIEPRQLCVIAGWGVSKPGEPSKNQYLHYLPVPIVDSEECNSTKHYNGLMSKDKICAGYTDSEKTPCYNDEGAPLMCFAESANTWELQGILSHHDNCAKSKHPAIYTSINEKMRKWVINTIGQKPASA